MSDDWQPIETAPKDREVLGGGPGWVRVMRWGRLYVAGRNAATGEMTEKYGWVVPGLPGSSLDPTNWQPLPAPPHAHTLPSS